MSNGITNGYQWYSISGGRQDYMNYWHHCREFTLEMSNTKLLPENQLDNFWNYNYRSLLNYLEQVLFGLNGIVTDSVTGEALAAKVFINGHDIDSSHVYSSLPKGNYNRPLFAGTYNITFSKSGYKSKTMQAVTIANRSTINLDVQLVPQNIGLYKAFSNNNIKVFPNPTSGVFIIELKDVYSDYYYNIFSIAGQSVGNGQLNQTKSIIEISHLKNGVYFVNIFSDKYRQTFKLVKI